MRINRDILAILLYSVFIHLPIFSNFGLLLERGDLKEFFWPIYYFSKLEIITNHSLPLWNNLFLSGTPLLPDPQSPLFYLPNIIFLLLPLDLAFIASLFFHLTLGSLGIYFLVRYGFNLNRESAFFSALLYISIPKLAGVIEAGHFGIAISYAWFPLIILSVIKLMDTKKFVWSVMLATTLCAVFYTHTLTFLISSLSVGTLFIILVIDNKFKDYKKQILLFILSIIVCFGLIAVTLLPQLEWFPTTTRNLLLENPDIYPKWQSYKEFIFSVIAPWSLGINFLQELDTEKWITLGIIPSLLALIGFFNLKYFYKILVLLVVLFIALISLNNLSPLYSTLISFDQYALLRVSTRFWFVLILIVVVLSAFAINKFNNKKSSRRIILALVLMALFESLILNWIKVTEPVNSDKRIAPVEVAQYLSKDSEKFRVFCTSRCISQKDAAIYNLELVEGYSTLHQQKYSEVMWQVTGKYWNYYTLAVPPAGIYNFEKIHPDLIALGELNTKYVISFHNLDIKDLVLEEEIQGFKIYRNLQDKKRSYYLDSNLKPGQEAKVDFLKPNHIKITTNKKPSLHLVVAETYNLGWKAYLNGIEQIAIQQTPNNLRLIDLKENTEFVELKYEPYSYKVGRIITISTIFIVLFGLCFNFRKKFSIFSS